MRLIYNFIPLTQTIKFLIYYIVFTTAFFTKILLSGPNALHQKSLPEYPGVSSANL